MKVLLLGDYLTIMLVNHAARMNQCCNLSCASRTSITGWTKGISFAMIHSTDATLQLTTNFTLLCCSFSEPRFCTLKWFSLNKFFCYASAINNVRLVVLFYYFMILWSLALWLENIYDDEFRKNVSLFRFLRCADDTGFGCSFPCVVVLTPSCLEDFFLFLLIFCKNKEKKHKKIWGKKKRILEFIIKTWKRLLVGPETRRRSPR